MLKFKLDPKAFEALSEAEQTFYKKDGDVYQLQVEGASDKEKLNEFRAKNVELLKQNEAYKDVDLAEWKEIQEQKRLNKDKELIDKKDFDGLLEQRLAPIQSDYEGKISALSQERDALYRDLSKTKIESEASKAFSKHKVNPELNISVLAEIGSMFTIDNGKVVAKDGDKILTGANGNLTIDEFIASKPESYKLPSNPGAGQGGNNHKPANTQTSVQRIAAGLKSVG